MTTNNSAQISAVDAYLEQHAIAICNSPVVAQHNFRDGLEKEIAGYNTRIGLPNKQILVLENERNVFIEKFVQEHLALYCNGTILEETEDKSRKSLIESLFPLLQKTYPNLPFKKDVVENLALNIYIDESAKALNRYFGVLVDPDDTKNSGTIDFFIDTMKHAIRIDFKTMHPNDDKIASLGRYALRTIHKQYSDSLIKKHKELF
jgi:hypothetical protein